MYEYYNYENNSNEGVKSEAQEPVKAKKKKDKKKGSFGKKLGAAVCFGLAFGIVASCAFVGVTRLADKAFPPKAQVIEQPKEKVVIKQAEPIKEAETKDTASTQTATRTSIAKTENGMSVSDVAINCMPSVVSITNKSIREVRSMFGMGTQKYENTSVGSGVIVGQNDTELLIVTNNHVIEGASSLTVGFADDEIYEATSKGADSDKDLAIVSVKLEDLKDETKDAITIATIGDSQDLIIGQQVVAIGNALGVGQSVTTGIVSALDREVTIEDVTNVLIQTDAAINPGNSGGALLNMKGELIGINSAKFASAQVEGMGFAIPTTTFVPIIEELMSRETREVVAAEDAGYLGITGVSVDKAVSKQYGIPEGVYLSEVEEDGPAAEAGLKKGDVIRKFDGVTVDSINEIREMMDYYKAGEAVDILIYRSTDGDYEEKTISVTLGGREGTPLDPANLENEEETDDSDEEIGNAPEDNLEIPFPFNMFPDGGFSFQIP